VAAVEAFRQVVTAVARRRRLRVGIGDAFLLTGDDPAEATTAAREVVEAMERVDFAPAVRIGIHAGPVSVRSDDVFGGTVNIAARVASEAHPGQVVVTGDVLTLAGEAAKSHALSLGTRRLRNVSAPVELFDTCHDRSSDKTIDPVCRMLVPPDTAAGALCRDGETFYFCSTDCLSRFIEATSSSHD
jgi:adenylate cyclase